MQSNKGIIYAFKTFERFEYLANEIMDSLIYTNMERFNYFPVNSIECNSLEKYLKFIF